MDVVVSGEWIQLDQLMKRENRISSGGEIRFFLASHTVLLNGEPVREKRKKIRPGDILTVDGEIWRIVGEKA